MRVLFLGLNYAPEEIGIAVYSTGLCEALAYRGHMVEAVVGKPYYPAWRVDERFRGGGTRHSVENGVTVMRVPHYVPRDPTGARRLAHHASFAASAARPMFAAATRMKPDIVMTIAPSLIAAPVARTAARLAGAKSWLHIQDFEVEAAFATGLLGKSAFAARMARAFESATLNRFDRVSSISLEMCRKVERAGVPARNIVQFRNWADSEAVAPLNRPSEYRRRWNITTPHVALYSGNIANKQGIEIIVEMARHLETRTDLSIVVCGEGPNRAKLEALAAGLPNIQFHDLQPHHQLEELMGLATIHLLPQKGATADLVLPSKLSNMLASGRPVVATAHEGTGLAREVEGAGIRVAPGNARAMADAVVTLMEDPALYTSLSTAARKSALANWDKEAILDSLEKRMLDLTADRPTIDRNQSKAVQ